MKVYPNTPQEYYMDETLNINLNRGITFVHKDMDLLVFVDGKEGSGKSVFTQQCALCVDPTFCLDRVVFTPTSFKRAVMNAQKFQAIIYDEAYRGLGNRASLSIVNRTLVSMLTEIRQKNLFIFIVMPSFFDSDRYVVLHRARCLLNVYFGDNLQRGFFKFYNQDKLKLLYLLGKKLYDYSKPFPNFRGRFTNHYVLDEEAYREKKLKALKSLEDSGEVDIQGKDFQDWLKNRIFGLSTKVPVEIKMEILGMKRADYYRKLKVWTDTKKLEEISD